MCCWSQCGGTGITTEIDSSMTYIDAREESVATINAIGWGARGLLDVISVAHVLRVRIIRIVFRWF